MEKYVINEYEQEILDAVNNNQVVIIQAETGAGKSTQIPPMLWRAGYKNITVTEPRTMAAITLANRVSEELEEKLGVIVGYKTRFDKTSGETPITYVTDGYLLSLYDSEKPTEGVVIIDEIHEFCLNQEALLGLYKNELNNINPNLKLIIMSATTDSRKVSEFFDNAPIINIPGKNFDVKKYEENQMSIGKLLEKYFTSESNMLIFLSGKAEIEEAYERVRDYFISKPKYRMPKIFRLHGEMNYDEQSQVFKSFHERKIVLATNVAQTSITIPDIDVVIDFGTCKQVILENGVSQIKEVPISQADCNQRAGRAGRCKNGVYILCSCIKYEDRPKFTTPEIKRMALEDVLLKLEKLHLNAENIEFLHNPDITNLKIAKELLQNLMAINAEGISNLGLKMERLPLTARNARIMVEASKYHSEVQGDMAIICAILECGDFRCKGFKCKDNASKECRKSDLTYQLYLFKKILHEWKICPNSRKKTFYYDWNIKKKVFTGIMKVSKDICDKLGIPYTHHIMTRQEDYIVLRSCIISAYVDNIYEFKDYYRGINFCSVNFDDILGRNIERSSLFSNPCSEIPKLVVGHPIDLEVNGYNGEQSLRLIRNITEIDLSYKNNRSLIMKIAKPRYIYDKSTNRVFIAYFVGRVELSRELCKEEHKCEIYTTIYGEQHIRILINDKVIADIPA